MTCNLLKILRSAGATLYLCDPVVEEVHRHLETSDWEFINYCEHQERFIDADIARHINKILIRAYFYAKLLPSEGVRPPAGWRSFVGQFCNYESLHQNPKGKRELQQYLVQRFGLEVFTDEDLDSMVNAEEARKLAEQLKPFKRERGQEVLALNDARMILAVYGFRRRRKEEYKGSAYGFSTWWLTHETRVQLATADLVKERGAKYILRPDFASISYPCLPLRSRLESPTRASCQHCSGVQLSNRMREEVFHDVMRRVDDALAIDDARARVMMGQLSNRLKGDFFKQYEVDWKRGAI